MKLHLSIVCFTSVSIWLLTFGESARGDLILQYNPTGSQASGTPLSPSFVDPAVTATSLSQVGLGSWVNTDALPVGQISSSSTVTLGEYLTFAVSAAGGQDIMFQNLQYDKQSYNGSGATLASLRSSLDGFATDIDTLHVNPSGAQSLIFNLSSLPLSSGAVTFRIYFYDAPINRSDWDDLLSTASGGNGLQLTGEIVPSPVPSTLVMSSIVFGMLGIVWAGKRLKRPIAA
jgi:hypothetical protein